MTSTGEAIVVCGRAFRPQDVEAIRAIIGAEDAPNRRQIATRTCELLNWRGLNGRLKEMSCRVALLRLHARRLITLPPPRNRRGKPKANIAQYTLHLPLLPIIETVEALEGLRVDIVASRDDSRVWNEAVSRFHYLGYTPLPGAQLRYMIHCASGLLAVIGFSASAWKIAARDRWIGWTAQQRQQRLHLIVNNARFLILPWVHVRNLASWILGTCARRIPADFEARYGYRPMLLETFVHADRYKGTCYVAANWTYLGDTAGRGKLDRYEERAVPVKRMYAYPLTRSFREALCAPLESTPVGEGQPR